ncbi:ShlB/FhaC/HecB family hemolysin secretion/activation protein [Azonexus sp.]|uniref:ShlB/FhaC/HecB family hemolysin secretion/activation protein n=1 Tax=Azonexus sp. TaxID=1872668 RepID=UPI0027BA5F3B|nr:ShlB/FhaC/HecB family hemolysin secretion/activation protein [Azonexus sp.]
MKKNKLLPFALLVLSQSLLAQQVPSAGGQMQQIPPIPSPPKAAPQIEVKPVQGSVMTAPDTATMIVQRLIVTGAQTYSEAELLALTRFVPGSELSLSQLRAMAAKIAVHYQRNGFFVAQAYLPAQDIKDGVVTIAVVEGRYGQITLNNQAPVSSALADGLLSGIQTGDPVTSAPLESRLLLLSDLPGVVVKSTLLPGAAVGTSDLRVDLTPGRRITGSVDADNAGNRYTGAYRAGATVNFNEPLGLGDVASLRVLTAGSGLNYGRAAYQLQLGKASVGVAYSYLEYELGKEFKSLDAHGTAQIASLYGRYPLIRSRNNNLYAGLALETKKFEDRVDTTRSVSDKRAHVATASLNGDWRDNFGGGGINNYAFAWGVGDIDLQTPVVRAYDDATARSDGHFNKFAFSAARLQRVTDSVSLSAALSGQWASKNLDVSEKMELGGMYGVRAYPEGEAYADEGYLLNLEARLQLPKFSQSMPGQIQLIGFVDTGTVTVHKNPWGPGKNTRTLSGAGVGANWYEANNFMVRAYYAFKLGSEDATSAPDKSGRFWLQLIKYF